MKLILCTLAVCLSILVSVFTTRVWVHEEGKRTRSSIAKTIGEAPDTAHIQESLSKKLDAINNQLAGLNRRLSVLEETTRAAPSSDTEAISASIQGTLSELRKELSSVTASLAKLNGVPELLAELTTYLGDSFAHLEKTTIESRVPEALTLTLVGMTQQLDTIGSYFTPLYAFLGLVYDPSNEDLLATYPSVDERINALYLQMQSLRQDIADVKESLTPRHMEAVKRQR